MRQNLAAAIAWRYLLAKKSHAAVATITTVSVCAMAIATAAIICVLSVFNGFRASIASRLDTLSPDIMITSAKGKAFNDAERLAARVRALPCVSAATPTLSDNALLICNSQEMPVTVKGVIPKEYASVTSVRGLIEEDFGHYFAEDTHDNQAEGIAAIGVAARIGALPGMQALVFTPRREGRVNMANPGASFLSDSVTIAGVYRTDQSQYDADGLLLPLPMARRLLMRESEASAIEARLAPGVPSKQAMEEIKKSLGGGFIVKDRMMQQEMNFRMVKIEKWVSFMLLGFILTIASFNLISSLSMLVIEKEGALSALRALGMSRRRIGHIFAWESLYVTIAGGVSGLALGLTLCLIQERFGLLKLGGEPGSTIMAAYPVEIQGPDILATMIPVAVIGLCTAAVTAAFAMNRSERPDKKS